MFYCKYVMRSHNRDKKTCFPSPTSVPMALFVALVQSLHHESCVISLLFSFFFLPFLCCPKRCVSFSIERIYSTVNCMQYVF